MPKRLSLGPALTTALPLEAYAVLDILGDQFDPATLDPEFGLTAEQIERLRQAILSVGRIESSRTNSYFFGTGFVVGPDIIATNRHVAEQFVRGQGRGAALTLRIKSSAINFRREQDGEVVDRRYKIVEPLLVHPYWDLALFRTEPLAATIPPLTLAATAEANQPDRVIVVIGYPANAGDKGMTTAVADIAHAVFGTVNGLKRLQPGRLRGPAAAAGSDPASLDHSASTLPGNSGSPVVDVQTGHVVGIHFGGQDGASNWSVPCCDVRQDRRIDLEWRLNFTPGGVLDPDGPWEVSWNALGDVF